MVIYILYSTFLTTTCFQCYEYLGKYYKHDTYLSKSTSWVVDLLGVDGGVRCIISRAEALCAGASSVLPLKCTKQIMLINILKHMH